MRAYFAPLADQLAYPIDHDLKLHCSVGHYEADDPRLDGVWALAARRGVPVVVHAGHATDGRTSGHEVAPIDRVAARHPGVALIIAHCCLLYTSPSPRDLSTSRMPSSA